jgi:5'-3' exonuclease
MGVPKFFAWLMRNYKKNKFVFEKEKVDGGLEKIDWLLIDTNCLIHPTCFKILAEEQQKENINFKSLQNKMKSIFRSVPKKDYLSFLDALNLSHI